MKKRILIVDDEKDTVKLIKSKLVRAGYDVKGAYSAKEALKLAYEYHPHLVILDLKLGEEVTEGFVVCQRLRELTNVPILILSAYGSEANKVRGLQLGADDYLVKSLPNTVELLARVAALLRRSQSSPQLARYSRYADGRLSIDLNTGQVMRSGHMLDLTPQDFELLTCLVKRAGDVLSHDLLGTEFLGSESRDVALRYVKVYIRQLRQKIETNPSKPEYIRTMRGRGYYFMPRKNAQLE